MSLRSIRPPLAAPLLLLALNAGAAHGQSFHLEVSRGRSSLRHYDRLISPFDYRGSEPMTAFSAGLSTRRWSVDVRYGRNSTGLESALSRRGYRSSASHLRETSVTGADLRVLRRLGDAHGGRFGVRAGGALGYRHLSATHVYEGDWSERFEHRYGTADLHVAVDVILTERASLQASASAAVAGVVYGPRHSPRRPELAWLHLPDFQRVLSEIGVTLGLGGGLSGRLTYGVERLGLDEPGARRLLRHGLSGGLRWSF